MSDPPPTSDSLPGFSEEPPRRRRSAEPWPWLIGALLVIVVAAGAAYLVLGGEEEAKAQTVTFQKPIDVGPDPFVDKPADKKGKKKVKITPSSTAVGAGPFGGTGSDLVCDRDLLVRSLKARPERLVEWARVLGVEPTIKAVGIYISKLHPVTLTRDTRVTNHTFTNGRAVGFQSILAAGTAVLVDDYGNPVVRCRCGNPLLKPVFIPTATCIGCPPRYQPPPACPYTEEITYRRRWYPGPYYSNASYDEVFIRRFSSPCYTAYPNPPIVRIVDVYDPDLRPAPPPPPPPPPPQAQPQQPPPPSQSNASASFSPTSGPVCRSYTLSASGFAPNRSLSISLVRPDGVNESYSMSTGPDGSGTYTFSAGPQCANDVQGTYTATVRDPQTGASAQASVHVSGGPQSQSGGDGSGSGTGSGELQCDPPRSQLESEQCAAAGRG